MKKLKFIIFVMLIETSILNATSYVKIKSITDSNLVDGGYYTIIFKKRSTFFDGPNGYPVTRTIYRKQTLDDAISTSTILKLVKINGNWHLINLEHGKYLCDDPNCSSQNDFGYSSEPNENSNVTLENIKYKSAMHLMFKIGIRGLYCKDDGDEFDLLMHAESYCTDYSIYRVMEIDDIQDIDDDHPLTSENKGTRICYKRNFDNTMENTFIFPFDIPDFSLKFGQEIIAYQPATQQNQDGKIIFSKVTNDTLKANIPYILEGNFYKEGALLNCSRTFAVTNNDNIEYKLSDDIIFHGVYNNYTNIARQKSLILYKDELYLTDKVSSMHVSPYRWYITLPNGIVAGSKLSIVINNKNNDNTSISTTIQKIKPINTRKNHTIYNLLGYRVNQNYKGIVIENGKKYIKR